VGIGSIGERFGQEKTVLRGRNYFIEDTHNTGGHTSERTRKLKQTRKDRRDA
jgi:hypothetical protein